MKGDFSEMKNIHKTSDENIYEIFFNDESSNSNKINNLKNCLNNALEYSLTNRQKEVIIRRYYNNEKVKNIASDLGISPSAVSRHIKRAQIKMKNVILNKNLL